MVRSATLTTVPSSNDIAEPRVAAATTARPVGVPARTQAGAPEDAEDVTTPP